MFERLSKRAAEVAERRAAVRRETLADRLREAVPAGVAVEFDGDGVALSGRGLGRRFESEAGLRWLVVEARDE